MKTLPTQFDNKKLTGAVATPTCSSCCCCCCCLATSMTATTLLAKRISKEGSKHNIPGRQFYTLLAALFVPLTGGLVYIGFWTINSLLETCTTRTIGGFGTSAYTYEVCTNPASGLILPMLVIAPFLVLWYLYSRVRINNPIGRAVLVTTLIAIAFTLEGFAGAALILTGVGGLIYLGMVPLIAGWITVWYYRHIGREFAQENSMTVVDKPSYQDSGRVEQEKDQDSRPDEPPKQQTPSPGTE